MRHKIRVSRLIPQAAAALCAVALVAACSSATSAHATTGQSTQPRAGSAAPAAPAAAALRQGEHFATLRLPQPYTPAAPNGGTDEYRCFLLDPKLAGTAYLTGNQFLPQNTAIVHHAIIYRISPDEVAQARQLDAGSPGEGWTCFGDSGVDGETAWVGHWAPGVNETLLSQGLGFPMPAGSMLVMQVHYNLLATGGRPGGSDQSAIRLRLTDPSSMHVPLQTVTLSAPIELPCAAGETGPLCDRAASVADVTRRFGPQVGSKEDELIRHCDGGVVTPGPTQHCDYPIDQAATVYAIAGHMHLLGRAISIVLNPGKPGARTLLDVPNYNFDNQEIVPLAQPVTVKSGDVLRVSCTYDAGLRKLLPQLRTLPPRYVIWGDGTSDEMCLGIAIVGGATG